MDDMQWVRPPKQERSQKTLDVFLNSVETLLEEQGVETLSVKDIAARANLSVGGFYARFPNKEAVLRALHLRFSTEAKATIDLALNPARWKGIHMQDAAPRLVGFLADDYRKRPGLRRAFLLLIGTDAEVKVRNQEVSGYTAGRFHGFLASKSADLEHDDLMLAADMLHRLLFSMLDNYALYKDGSSTGRGIQHDVFVSELSGAVLRYLRVKPKPLQSDLSSSALSSQFGGMPAADPMTLPTIGGRTMSTPLSDPHSLPPMPSPTSSPGLGRLPAADAVTIPIKGPNSEW